ncbi:hypothetical protein QFC24_006272 [Naganishia onofrii]|uniref:Uncharacterized protein n=1 Tax=Naganishia onofrii TaxID=1851511 RepID=A0ACC2X4U7_9TREE|nr:hypothetical protein QFC24_006272 [Naganishia onofrii]
MQEDEKARRDSLGESLICDHCGNSTALPSKESNTGISVWLSSAANNVGSRAERDMQSILDGERGGSTKEPDGPARTSSTRAPDDEAPQISAIRSEAADSMLNVQCWLQQELEERQQRFKEQKTGLDFQFERAALESILSYFQESVKRIQQDCDERLSSLTAGSAPQTGKKDLEYCCRSDLLTNCECVILSTR